MSKQLTDRELEALFQTYLPTDEIPPDMAQRIENRVLYEVGQSLRIERQRAAALARQRSWIGRLFGRIPNLRIGPSLALAGASMVAMLLIVTYGVSLINRLDEGGNSPQTGSTIIQDTPTPEVNEGSVEVVAPDVTATSTNTQTPTLTATPEAPAEDESPDATPVVPSLPEPSETATPDNAEAPARGDTAEETATTTVAEGAVAIAPTATAGASATEDSSTDIASTPNAGATKTANIFSSPEATPTLEPAIPTKIAVTTSPTPSGTRATATPTASVEVVVQRTPSATPTPTRSSATASPTLTALPQLNNTATATPTNRPTQDVVPTRTPKASVVPTKTSEATNTPTPMPTVTAIDTATPTVVIRTTSTSTATATPTRNSDGSPTAVPTQTATSTVTLVGNKPPVPVSDSSTLLEEQSVRIAVLLNDTDPEDDPLTILSVGTAGHGSATIVGNQVQYVPVKDYHGTDTFTYTIFDGHTEATSNVLLTILPVNDPPVANTDSIDTSEDSVAQFNALANDTDVDLDALSIRSFSQAAHGIVALEGTTFVYKPTLNYNGADSFTYIVTDGSAEATAQVNIQIAAVNDPPSAILDNATVAEDQSVAVALLENDRDVEGDSLTIVAATNPRSGTVTISADRMTVLYTPNSNFNGTDEFSYTITDGSLTAQGVVRVLVTAVNDAPVAINDTIGTDEDTPVVVDVTANDSDVDGDTLLVTAFEQGQNGVVSADGNRLLYMPNKDFFGSDQFKYTISDGKESSSATVAVTISSVDDSPLARDDAATVAEDGSVVISVLGNDSDPEGQPLSIAQVSTAQNGVVAIEGNNVRYTPKQNFNGTDQFTYTLLGGAEPATVTITVTPVDDPPTAAPDSASTTEDTPVTISVLDNDTDIDSTLQISGVAEPQHGTATVEGNTVRYTPKRNFNGSDQFTYTLLGAVDPVAVTITVTPVNDPPKAKDDNSSTNMNETIVIEVLSNDVDVDSENLTISIVNQPANGSAVISNTLIIYTPNDGYFTREGDQPEQFVYRLSDGEKTDDATVRITVINRPPMAVDDSATTDANQAVKIAVLENDSDPDGTALTIAGIGAAGSGTTRIEGATIVYLPNPGFTGSDSFTYVVSDGANQAEAVVTVEVSNSAPDAQDDAATTIQGQAVAISPLINDSDSNGDSLTLVGISQPQNGTAVRSDSVITYTPNISFTSGSDSFTYIVSDGIYTTTATVHVTVNAQSAP